MSIASEIKRLITAKSNLKTSFQKRNIPIENETIDKYAEKLDFAAVALNGSFVPEQDTRIFQIKGLSFTPTAIQISNNELYD